MSRLNWMVAIVVAATLLGCSTAELTEAECQTFVERARACESENPSFPELVGDYERFCRAHVGDAINEDIFVVAQRARDGSCTEMPSALQSARAAIVR